MQWELDNTAEVYVIYWTTTMLILITNMKDRGPEHFNC